MHTGDVLRDRFEVVEAAGSGGMGVVYRAIDRATGSTVAVKLLHDAASPQHVARFAHEAEILGEIDHPNVVRYVTHGMTASEEPYLVMEWLDGVSLAEHLKRGPLSIGESIELVRCVASALAAAHGRGVVHRDIKPSNVFLPDDSSKYRDPVSGSMPLLRMHTSVAKSESTELRVSNSVATT